MGPSMYLGMILLFILIYNRKLMRTMDNASVLRYAVIVALLGTDQPEGTICTVLSNRLRVVSLQTSSASPSFKSEQWGRQILGMPNPKEKSSFPKGNKEKSKEKSIVFFGDTEKSKAHKGEGEEISNSGDGQQKKTELKTKRVGIHNSVIPRLGIDEKNEKSKKDNQKVRIRRSIAIVKDIARETRLVLSQAVRRVSKRIFMHSIGQISVRTQKLAQEMSNTGMNTEERRRIQHLSDVGQGTRHRGPNDSKITIPRTIASMERSETREQARADPSPSVFSRHHAITGPGHRPRGHRYGLVQLGVGLCRRMVQEVKDSSKTGPRNQSFQNHFSEARKARNPRNKQIMSAFGTTNGNEAAMPTIIDEELIIDAEEEDRATTFAPEAG